MESRLEQAGPANQSFVQIPFSSTNDHLSTGFDASDSCPSILNYSIQTGEEFSLEFIRERANATKASGENASATQSIGVCKVKNGIIGALQSDLENEVKVELKSFAAIDSMRESESGKWEMPMTPSVSAIDGNDRGISKKHACSVSSDHSVANVRFFCSFGGKIMPRPSDGKLRYVGGATHIIRLRNDVSFQEVMQKTSSIYNKQHTIKYQLPGEDLDSLISVSCNEDLQNMMEECNFLEVDGSQKLRMFLFASGDTDDLQFGLGGMESGSEMQYVAAVNGLEFEFDRGNSDHVLSKTAASVSAFDHLLNFGNEDGNAAMNRVEMVPIRVNAVPLRELMYPQISIYDHRPSLHSHQTHAEYAVGDEGFSQLAMLPMHTNGNQSNVDGNFSAISPSPSMYNRKNDNGQSEGNLVSLAISQSLLVENVEGQDIKKDVPKLPKHKSEGQFQSLENEPIFTNHQHGGSAKFEEESCSHSISGFVAPNLLSHKVLESEKKSPEFEVSNVQFHNLHGDDHSCNCSSPCSSRAYQSEGISREPFRDASLSIFRSKSHDSIGSQFLIPNSHSNLVYEDPICEPLNKLQFEESASLTQQSILLAKLECPSSLEMKNGVRKIENSLEIHDHSQMNTHLELVSDLNGKKYPHIFSDVDINEASTSQNRHNKSSEVTRTPCNLEDAESGNIEGHSTPIGNSKIDVTNPSIETTFEHQCDSDSFLPYFNWVDGYYFTNSKNIDYEPQLRDVLADINNRFPPGMVSGIFKARNDKDSSILDPLYKEKVALSVNMHNPDKKNWSYFQNLAQDQFHKEVSLIDQDHDDQYFPDTTNKEVSPQPYNSAPQKSEYFELDHDDDSQIDLGEVMQRGGSGIDDDDDNPYHQGFLSPRIRIGMDGEGMQVENPFLKAGDNLRDPLPDDEEGKLNSRNADCPSVFVYGDCHLNNLQSIKNEDLEELKELGSGTFGTVYHGQWRGTDVAIKRIKKSCLTCHLSEQERLTMEFWREAEILSNLHHPNVLAFYGVVTDGLDSTLATITEFMVDGSLSNVLRNGRSLDYRKELIIAMDTAFGMEYLHSKNIVHFDLKCDNLLVNLKDPLRPICKVGDFGLSKIKQNTLVSGGVRGTLPWMAPELLSSSKVSEKVDVFSFGIVMWEILTGEEPYSNMHYGAIIGGILNNILRPPIPESCNPEWRMLMEQCWDADPIHRPSFTEIATHLRVMYAAHCDKLLHVKAAK